MKSQTPNAPPDRAPASICLSFNLAVRWSGLTERVIAGAIRSGELLVVRRGRRIFIVRDDLVRFLQRQCVPVPDGKGTVRAAANAKGGAD